MNSLQKGNSAAEPGLFRICTGFGGITSIAASHAVCYSFDFRDIKTRRHTETVAPTLVPRGLTKLGVTSAEDLRLVTIGTCKSAGNNHNSTKTFLSVTAVNERSPATSRIHKLSAPTPGVETAGPIGYSAGTHGDSIARDRHKVCISAV